MRGVLAKPMARYSAAVWDLPRRGEASGATWCRLALVTHPFTDGVGIVTTGTPIVKASTCVEKPEYGNVSSITVELPTSSAYLYTLDMSVKHTTTDTHTVYSRRCIEPG